MRSAKWSSQLAVEGNSLRAEGGRPTHTQPSSRPPTSSPCKAQSGRRRRLQQRLLCRRDVVADCRSQHLRPRAALHRTSLTTSPSAAMKLQVLLAAILLSLLITDVLGDKVRKFKKYRRHHRTTSTTTTTEVEPELSDESAEAADDKDVFSMLEQDDKAPEKQDESLPDTEIKDNNVIMHDPCVNKHCGAGRVCEINDGGEAECICIPDCPVEKDPRRKVCSNHNETWGSDCEVYQMRCWCEKGLSQCRGDQYEHVHIEYYGICRDMPDCKPEEMADFPRRMRDWLFNIMRDLADRQELTPHYLKMEREAENNLTRRWSNAAVWKWCDLDGHPADRSVSRHELFPIRAPLMALEHCIAPFLDSCDVNDDHRITLKEWGKCLELDEDDLDEKCDDLRDGNE